MQSTTHYDAIQPTETDRLLAQESSQRLAALLADNRDSMFQLLEEQHRNQKIPIPFAAVQLLMDILSEMAQGHAVSLIPVHAELTTQQAADYLNVSRPYLINLLDKGHIPYRKVGSHRRIRFEDLKTYKDHIDTERLNILSELTKQAQELNLGY